jgi:hypothetical protein
MPMLVYTQHNALPHSSDIPRISRSVGRDLPDSSGRGATKFDRRNCPGEGRRPTRVRENALSWATDVRFTLGGWQAPRRAEPSARRPSRAVEGCLARPPPAEELETLFGRRSIRPSKSSPGPPPASAPSGSPCRPPGSRVMNLAGTCHSRQPQLLRRSRAPTTLPWFLQHIACWGYAWVHPGQVDKIIQMIPSALEDFREVSPCCAGNKRQICTTSSQDLEQAESGHVDRSASLARNSSYMYAARSRRDAGQPCRLTWKVWTAVAQGEV